MKAIVYRQYGSPDALRLEEIEKPVPQDNEVLIEVRAASVNPLDWRLMRGKPLFTRPIIGGVRKPKSTRPGRDVAGQVEAVGRNVTQFKPGDEVFGACRGAFAEYVCVIEDKLALKPANISFEDAAAVPVAALTALQGLRDKGRIQRGQKVLVDGASAGGGWTQILQAMLLGPLLSLIGSKKMRFFMAKINKKDLVLLKELLEAGKAVPIIDRRYPLSGVAEAIRYLEEGHARGKVVITLEHNKRQ